MSGNVSSNRQREAIVGQRVVEAQLDRGRRGLPIDVRLIGNNHLVDRDHAVVVATQADRRQASRRCPVRCAAQESGIHQRGRSCRLIVRLKISGVGPCEALSA